MRHRGIQLAIGGWLAANVGLIALAGGHPPFHASSLAQPPTVAAVLSADAIFVEVFALMVVVHLADLRTAAFLRRLDRLHHTHRRTALDGLSRG